MSKMGNYVVGAEEDGTIIYNEQENCYEEVDNKNEYKYHCNECYSKEHKSNEEGCFTNNPKKWIKDKIPPCVNGTWEDQEHKFTDVHPY